MNTKTKIISRETLKKKLVAIRKSGKKIAFTNGCFDIMHFGHVCYLEEAKKNDRILIIGLNSDVSVKKIKGSSRPIIHEKGRATLLAALQCVDFVTLFDEDTPYELIKYLRPDILIKGADWKNKGIAGADVVKENGGKVEYIKYIDGFSTTNIIEKISKSAKSGC